MEKEYLKMAMLKHEETFRQQVYELHRLYRTQTILMKTIEKSSQNGWNSKSWEAKNEICFNQIYQQDTQNYYRSNRTVKLDLEKPAAEDEPEANNGVLQIINESEIELTLGPSSYNTSDSGATLSSSSTGSSHEGKQPDTEQVKGQELQILGVIEASSGYQNGSSLREKKMLDYPPRLFQVVSLNLT